MKKFFGEFKQFIQRGNVMDLAVGIIIGGAFKEIVNSLVNDMLMPVISLVFKFDVKSAVLIMRGSETGVDPSGLPIYADGTVLLKWGAFLQAILDFLIIAFVIFAIIKLLNNLREGAKRKKEKAIARLEKKKAKGVQLSAKEQDEIDAVAAELEVVAEPKPTVEELLMDIKELLANKEEAK
ncbi:MAG: large conductance mechanosensitive channel protein MscL [Bacilli bacterium]|nr:large conductance mechanosensitive channel protein MscL [Bacilli bacterium]